MPLPRRHYRRLLLPPGWVALGFLLLLGCRVLLAQRRQLQQERILPLLMPFYSAKQAKAYETPGEHYDIGSYKPLASLINAPHWHTVNFTGKPLNDFFATAATEVKVRALKNDTSSAGIHLVFITGATYGNLVSLLNILQRRDFEKYWLDIHGKTSVFYGIGKAIKSKPIIKERTHVLYQQDFCGTRDYQIVPQVTLAKPTWLEQSTSWRPVILLLIALSALSLHRLIRPRRLTR